MMQRSATRGLMGWLLVSIVSGMAAGYTAEYFGFAIFFGAAAIFSIVCVPLLGLVFSQHRVAAAL